MTYGGSGYGGPFVNNTPPGASGRYGYGPTRYMLRNRIDIYARVPVKDKDRATVPTYVLAAPAVPCSVQQIETLAKYEEGSEAIIQWIQYRIYLAQSPGSFEYDYVLWVDEIGTTHKILVRGTRSLAGRGYGFVIDAEEQA